VDITITNLLTARRDPARRKRMSSDLSMFQALRASIAAHGQRLVMLHDCLRCDDDETTSFVRVPPGGNPYFQRWRNITDYLKLAGDTIERVWCVDATDVVMLHDPFPHMIPGEFYTGSEPRSLVGDTDHHHWLYRHHPSRQWFYDAHPELFYMNPGILGGDVGDVLTASSALGAEPDHEMTDMGAWQQICHDLFGDRVRTGHPVHTLYRALDHDNPDAWWAHK
jgi:hypothetical protein